MKKISNHIFFKQFTVLFFTVLLLYISSCGLYRPTDARKVPPSAKKRAEKNVQEGRGFRLLDSQRNKGNGVFDFASSNEMWRATLDLLEFTPLSNVDYSGGIIITEWFADEDSKNDSVKITVRFLSNEIRADGINIIIYKKSCTDLNNCKVSRIKSSLENEIKLAILKEAAILESDERIKNPDFEFEKTDSEKAKN